MKKAPLIVTVKKEVPVFTYGDVEGNGLFIHANTLYLKIESIGVCIGNESLDRHFNDNIAVKHVTSVEIVCEH